MRRARAVAKRREGVPRCSRPGAGSRRHHDGDGDDGAALHKESRAATPFPRPRVFQAPSSRDRAAFPDRPAHPPACGTAAQPFRGVRYEAETHKRPRPRRDARPRAIENHAAGALSSGAAPALQRRLASTAASARWRGYLAAASVGGPRALAFGRPGSAARVFRTSACRTRALGIRRAAPPERAVGPCEPGLEEPRKGLLRVARNRGQAAALELEAAVSGELRRGRRRRAAASVARRADRFAPLTL